MFKQKDDTIPNSNIMQISAIAANAKGRVGIPILLYFLGVPGVVVLILWALFFRG